MTYNYSFVIWLDETLNWSEATICAMRLLNGRIEVELTEAEFEKFRAGCREDGFILHEIERVPHHKPETIL